MHTFDSGAAYENLALQGAAMGLVVHGMAGFDRGKARATLGVPDEYEVEAMVAVGHPGDPAELPPQLQGARYLRGGRRSGSSSGRASSHSEAAPRLRPTSMILGQSLSARGRSSALGDDECAADRLRDERQGRLVSRSARPSSNAWRTDVAERR